MRANTGFLELRRLETACEIANLLATSGNRVMLDSQSLLLNGAYNLQLFIGELDNEVVRQWRAMQKSYSKFKYIFDLSKISIMNAHFIVCDHNM